MPNENNNNGGDDLQVTTGCGWLEQGNVYVMANIRGGGEFGPEWHQAALKSKRHKVRPAVFGKKETVFSVTYPVHDGDGQDSFKRQI